MQKILLFILTLTFSINAIANDVIGAGTPWVPEATPVTWTVSANNELCFDGTGATAAAPAVIATTFDGLTTNGTETPNWNCYAGLTLTFDAYISSVATDWTSVLFRAKVNYAGGKGVMVQVSKSTVQVSTNFGAAIVLSDANYSGQVNQDAYNSFKIEVATDGTITVTINNYICPTTYSGTLGLFVMTATAPPGSPALFCTSFSGFKLKNLIAVKSAGTVIALGGSTATVAGGTKTFFTVAAGLNDMQQNNALVYPNPTKGNFTVSNQAVGSKYKITNMLGQELKSGNILNTKQTIDLSNEQSGIYLLTIDGKSRKEVTSIIKQ